MDIGEEEGEGEEGDGGVNLNTENCWHWQVDWPLTLTRPLTLIAALTIFIYYISACKMHCLFILHAIVR